MSRPSIAAAILVLVTGCGTATPAGPTPDLSAWRVDRAPGDVAAAVADWDYRVLSLMGIGSYTPGIADRDHWPTAWGNPVGNYCLGGSDVVSSPGELRLIRAMEAYATRYNRLMADYLAAHPRPATRPAGEASWRTGKTPRDRRESPHLTDRSDVDRHAR